MINVVVAGAAGRMGSRIVNLIFRNPEMKLVGAIERDDHPYLGKDVGEICGTGKLGLEITSNLQFTLEKAQVLIEFTTPAATLDHLELCRREKKAMVIGTTGFQPEEIARIKEASSIIPCVLAPNMSVGVNVLFKIVKEIVGTLGSSYDAEVIEMHHRGKKDAPSGTALRLGEILAASRGEDLQRVAIYGRKGLTGERKPEEIGIHSLRGGDVVGDHIIVFAGEGERLEITHRAHSRDTFAHGALRAAKFVVTAPAGLYDMQDVLGLR